MNKIVILSFNSQDASVSYVKAKVGTIEAIIISAIDLYLKVLLDSLMLKLWRLHLSLSLCNHVTNY